MKIAARGVMRFAREEAELLADVLRGSQDEIGAVGRPGAVTERLYPDAYRGDAPADREAADEFRRLTQVDLRDSRLARLTECAEELEQTGGEIALNAEVADRWMRALNDVRLLLGTRLGVTDDYDHEVDARNPAAPQHALYSWLTAVQDVLVRSL